MKQRLLNLCKNRANSPAIEDLMQSVQNQPNPNTLFC